MMITSNIDLLIILFKFLIDPLVLEKLEGLGTQLLEQGTRKERLYGSAPFKYKDLTR